MQIAQDDSLFIAHVHYKYLRTEYDYKAPGYPKPILSQQIASTINIIGPYTSTTPIKGMITRFRERHNRDKGFEITQIKVFKTDFDWKETDL